MRVLLLRRESFGGIVTHTQSLYDRLPDHGIEAALLEADWIPDKTGPKVDKGVSDRLRQVAKDYDLVHGFGYRCAWACAAAFGSSELWMYTAWNMPKTTHPLLIGKLNDCAAGICTSRAVHGALDEAIAIHLETVPPGIAPFPDLPDRESLRARLRIEPDEIAIGALGRLIPEKGFDALIQAMDSVWEAYPNARLLISGKGPAEAELKKVASAAKRPERVQIVPVQGQVHLWFGALDLFVTPSRRAGTSLATLEAMRCGLPVLVRNTGGLAELIDEDISGMSFVSDESLPERINEMLGLPLTLEALGNAAKVRVEEHFGLEENVERHARIYRNVSS